MSEVPLHQVGVCPQREQERVRKRVRAHARARERERGRRRPFIDTQVVGNQAPLTPEEVVLVQHLKGFDQHGERIVC